MLLKDKNAVIYGGGGSIGSAVASAFAREGARVFLAGRTPESLEEVAEQIRSAGGVAETAQVDALDETAVDEHADAVATKALRATAVSNSNFVAGTSCRPARVMTSSKTAASLARRRSHH